MSDYKPRSKRGKMDTSTSEDTEISILQTPPIPVETPTFKFLEQWMKTTQRPHPICLVGAKGVGKTIILKQLANSLSIEYYDLADSRKFASFLSLISTEQEQAQERTWILIDNIQLAVNNDCTLAFVRTRVKQSRHYPDFKVVAASSRAGILTLMRSTTLKLNTRDFQVIVVNPDEDVANKVLEQQVGVKIYAEHKEVLKSWLAYSGFILGEVEKLCDDLTTHKSSTLSFERRIERFKIRGKDACKAALREDRQFFKEFNNDMCFIKCLSMSILGKGVATEKLSHCYQITMEELPWTFLKCTDDDLITAVSEQAKEAMTEMVCRDDVLLIDVIGAVKLLELTYGSMLCELFEKLVVGEITRHGDTKIELKKLGPTTKIINCLLVAPTTVVKKKYLPDSFSPSTNCCYHTPYMEHIDIILNVDDEIYLIQCTIDKNPYGKKGFWETAEKREWMAVFLGPECIGRECLGRDSDLARAYKAGKFWFADASCVLKDDILMHFT